MRIRAFGLLVLSAATLAVAEEPKAEPELPAALFQHWIHSREEDAGGVKVYRPSGFKFPPSRGRTGFEIRKNGEFIYHDIAPADGILKVPGRWTAEGKDRIVATFPNTKRKPLTLEIVSVDEKMLKVR
jgi:hypothetical protein